MVYGPICAANSRFARRGSHGRARRKLITVSLTVSREAAFSMWTLRALAFN